MTALSDALQTAQSAALAALARQYVRGPLGAQDDGTGALIASLERLGLDDLVDATRWVAWAAGLERATPAEIEAERANEPDDRERQEREKGNDQADAPERFAQLRREAYDLSTCPNGPDEYGNWPCDPQVLFGGGYAECQACGRVAAWGRETTRTWAKG